MARRSPSTPSTLPTTGCARTAFDDAANGAKRAQITAMADVAWRATQEACGLHAEPGSVSCYDVSANPPTPLPAGPNRAAWCDQPWCYVDSEECAASDKASSSPPHCCRLRHPSSESCWLEMISTVCGDSL